MSVKFFVAERVWKGPDATLNFCCPIHNAPSGLTRALRFSTQRFFLQFLTIYNFSGFFSPRFSVKYSFEVFTYDIVVFRWGFFHQPPSSFLRDRVRWRKRKRLFEGGGGEVSWVQGARSSISWGNSPHLPPPLSPIPLLNTQRPQPWISLTASIWRSWVPSNVLSSASVL